MYRQLEHAKVKVKLPCPCLKIDVASRGMVPVIRTIGARESFVVNSTPRPL